MNRLLLGGAGALLYLTASYGQGWEETPILVGDGSLIIDPFDPHDWDYSEFQVRYDGMRSSIAEVQLYRQLGDKAEEYGPMGPPICGTKGTPRCDKVKLTYVYGLPGRRSQRAVLTIYDRTLISHGVKLTWRHAGHTFDFDWDFVRSPLDPTQIRAECRSEVHAFPRSGCPQGRITSVEVNNTPVKLGDGKHRVRIVLRSWRPRPYNRK